MFYVKKNFIKWLRRTYIHDTRRDQWQEGNKMRVTTIKEHSVCYFGTTYFILFYFFHFIIRVWLIIGAKRVSLFLFQLSSSFSHSNISLTFFSFIHSVSLSVVIYCLQTARVTNVKHVQTHSASRLLRIQSTYIQCKWTKRRNAHRDLTWELKQPWSTSHIYIHV